MEKIVVETLCADLAAEGDCPGAGWNALWEWLTDMVAPAAAAEEAILAPVESQSAACASAFPALAVVSAALMAALVALGIAVYWLRNSRRALRRALYTDVRTGFLNQEGFRRRFEAKVRADNRASYCVVCFHFILGHIERIGGPGEILRFHRFVADVLHRRAVGNMDIGLSKTGDVFVLRQGKSPLSMRKWALHVLDEIRAYECAGAPLNRRDATVGVFPLASRDCCDCNGALFHARQCAIRAGNEGMYARVCGADKCYACEEERELLSDLERGLEQGEFQLYVQFFVNAEDFSFVGGEALSRWQHPAKGLLNPGRYIPLLEREDRIGRLDMYNLEKACALLQRLHEAGKEEFYLTCNLSRLTFAGEKMVERCRALLERYDFPRRELIFEITESGTIRSEDAAQMRANILAMRELGVQIMFDDFGMGYAAFRDLQEYPMDGLKLDREFVENMGTEQGQAITEGIIRTGHRLGITILAEGVEHEWQVKALQALRCDLLQGYFFAMPMPAEEAFQRVAGKEEGKCGARTSNAEP
ncbi:MAG: EAL domain-containing protein [Clostridiales bacterium]|nr:EAL domain-containing protein [Clostridiales bacterium]